MNQTNDMTETTASIIVAVVAVLLWLARALFSETRRNHGFRVPFLLPLAPLIFPVLRLIYISIKYPFYQVFIALGRTGKHEKFMRKVKIRSGVFLFFNTAAKEIVPSSVWN